MTYPIKQARSGNSSPRQSMCLLGLEVLDQFFLLAEKRQQLQHGLVLTASRELRRDESLHACLDCSIYQFLLFAESRSPEGRDDSILALEGDFKAGRRKVGLDNGDSRREISLAFLAGDRGDGELRRRKKAIKNNLADVAAGLELVSRCFVVNHLRHSRHTPMIAMFLRDVIVIVCDAQGGRPEEL